MLISRGLRLLDDCDAGDIFFSFSSFPPARLPPVPSANRLGTRMMWLSFSTFAAYWIVRVCIVECFSLHPSTGSESHFSRQMENTVSHKDCMGIASANHIDIENLDEGQVLLACRSYLVRKHKLVWEGKNQREEAATSPLFNEGYFWHNPRDLLYLREKPDPYNLVDDSYYSANTFGNHTERNERMALEYVPSILDIESSTNPFSTYPMHPSEEHIRRSNSRRHLWINETWKELWYNKRWKGYDEVTESHRKQKQVERLLDEIPSRILESPQLKSLSEEELSIAVMSYLRSNRKKSVARKNFITRRLRDREELLRWKNVIKKSLRNSTTLDYFNLHNSGPLSFEPTPDIMKNVRLKRAEKSKKGWRTRLHNFERTANIKVSLAKKLTNFKQNFSDHAASIDPIQAILRIDNALDNGMIPSDVDVKTILQPGRLGRRRAILIRILSECFDLRGKCIPINNDDSAADAFSFVTTCKIKKLGDFVLTKLMDTH